MQLQARLVHAESGRRVVELSAHRNGELLGSTMGEGATAEEAEDRALARLQTRLQARLGSDGARPPFVPVPASEPTSVQSSLPEPQPRGIAATRPDGAGQPSVAATQEPPPDPEDWSSELAQVDLQLRRLGWQREQEGTYLKRAFGHPSRGRLTAYSDLLAYLQALEALEVGSDPSCAPVPLRRRELLAQCDALLSQLRWNASQGRHFLEHQFQVSSRQQLSDAQLLQFNMLLESELLAL